MKSQKLVPAKSSESQNHKILYSQVIATIRYPIVHVRCVLEFYFHSGVFFSYPPPPSHLEISWNVSFVSNFFAHCRLRVDCQVRRVFWSGVSVCELIHHLAKFESVAYLSDQIDRSSVQIEIFPCLHFPIVGVSANVSHWVLSSKCVALFIPCRLASKKEMGVFGRYMDMQSADNVLLGSLPRPRQLAPAPADTTRVANPTITLGDLERHPTTGKLIPSFAVGGAALQTARKNISPRSRGASTSTPETTVAARNLSLATEEAIGSGGYDQPMSTFRPRLASVPAVLASSETTGDGLMRHLRQKAAQANTANGVRPHTQLHATQSSPASRRSPKKGDSPASSLRGSFRKLRRKLSLHNDRPSALPIPAANSENTLTPSGSATSTPRVESPSSNSGDRTPMLDPAAASDMTPIVGSGRYVEGAAGPDGTMPSLTMSIIAAMDAVRQSAESPLEDIPYPPSTSTPKRSLSKQKSAPLLSSGSEGPEASDGTHSGERRGSEIERLRQFFESLSNSPSDQKPNSKLDNRPARMHNHKRSISPPLQNGRRGDFDVVDSDPDQNSPLHGYETVVWTQCLFLVWISLTCLVVYATLVGSSSIQLLLLRIMKFPRYHFRPNMSFPVWTC